MFKVPKLKYYGNRLGRTEVNVWRHSRNNNHFRWEYSAFPYKKYVEDAEPGFKFYDLAFKQQGLKPYMDYEDV